MTRTKVTAPARRMSPRDAGFLYLERPNALLHIGCVAVVEGTRAGLRPGRLANLIATNVPGPREPRWLAGRRVEALYPIVPIVDGIGLGVAVFSYDESLHFGLNADAALVPDLDKLRHGIESAFERLARGV